MIKSVFAMLRVLMFGVLMLPMVSCEEDVIDDKDKTEQETGKNEDFFVNAIDLGLSVKWAEHNVGATKPEEYGDYYAWGEVEVKNAYRTVNYKYVKDIDGDGDYWDDDNNWVNIGSNISGTEYDAAHVKWGGWRIPTLTEIQELLNKCSWMKTSVNGVNGYKVTGPNGNSIFLPAAGSIESDDDDGRGSCGYYWSSTLSEDTNRDACNLCFSFYSEDFHWDDDNRYMGLSIRPVKDK